MRNQRRSGPGLPLQAEDFAGTGTTEDSNVHQTQIVKVYNVLRKHLEELLEKPLPLEQFRALITASTVTEQPFRERHHGRVQSFRLRDPPLRT
jgi:hypothetical protein